MLPFQVQGMAETRERGAFVTYLLVECGESPLVLDGDGKLPGRAVSLGFMVGLDGLLELSLIDAARGQQAHERGAGPQGPRRKRAQGCFDPLRTPIAQ